MSVLKTILGLFCCVFYISVTLTAIMTTSSVNTQNMEIKLLRASSSFPLEIMYYGGKRLIIRKKGLKFYC